MSSAAAVLANAPQNYYKVLGVKKDSGEAEIRDAYKVAVIKAHPDKPGGSAEQFKLVQKAYETLKSPEARRTHNKQLAEAQKVRSFRGTRPAPLAAVKTPVQFKLIDGTVYDFETAPDKFRCRFRHGDVVQGPGGEVGVIVGLASNGVYWCKSDSGVATLLFSQGMGGDRDIKLIFKSPKESSSSATPASSSSSGTFTRKAPTPSFRKATSSTASTPTSRRPSGATASTPRPSTTASRSSFDETAGLGSTYSGSSGLRGATRATTGSTPLSKPSTARGTAKSGSQGTMFDRHNQRRIELLQRKLAREEQQHRKVLENACDEYFAAFHDSLTEWRRTTFGGNKSKCSTPRRAGGGPSTPRLQRRSVPVFHSAVPVRRNSAATATPPAAVPPAEDLPHVSPLAKQPRNPVHDDPMKHAPLSKSGSSEAGVSSAADSDVCAPVAAALNKERTHPVELDVNTSVRYTAAVYNATPRSGASPCDPCTPVTPSSFTADSPCSVGSEAEATERREKLQHMLEKTQEMKRELFRSNRVVLPRGDTPPPPAAPLHHQEAAGSPAPPPVAIPKLSIPLRR